MLCCGYEEKVHFVRCLLDVSEQVEAEILVLPEANVDVDDFELDDGEGETEYGM